MRDPLVCLFLDAATHHLEVGKKHASKFVRIAERELALISLQNAMCCRNLTKSTKLEILGIQAMIEGANNA